MRMRVLQPKYKASRSTVSGSSRAAVWPAQCSGTIQLPGNLSCAVVLDLAPGKRLFYGLLKGCYDCAARTVAAFRNAGVVDPQAVKPGDLFVVGYGISFCILGYILRYTSSIQGCMTGGVGA